MVASEMARGWRMAEKRRALGRGLGALIPSAPSNGAGRPVDVFFAEQKQPHPAAPAPEAPDANGANVANGMNGVNGVTHDTPAGPVTDGDVPSDLGQELDADGAAQTP